MKKHLILFTLIIGLYSTSVAQQQRLKIAIFTPLFLDSAITGAGELRSGKTFPKYVTAGLDFYLGAQAALDSLQKRNAPLEVFIYDLKDRNTLSRLQQLPSFNLIIGHTNVAETRTLSNWAASRKTPFISATLPNNAGVKDNPYLVILNSSLEAHIEAISQFLHRNFGQQKIIYLTKQGAQEDHLKRTIQSLSNPGSTRPMNIKFVDVGDNFTTGTIATHLDSTQKNIIVSGSLQESFNQKLVQQLSTLSSLYPTAIVGMPTLENLNLNRLSPNLEVFYTTPFNYTRNSSLESRLTNEYIAKTGTRPSDLYYRGYESTLRFALLLLDTSGALSSDLSRKGNSVFTNFNIQPVYKDRGNTSIDYYENKNLYFIRTIGGSKSVYN